MRAEAVVRAVVAVCITVFGSVCIVHGLDHAVVATVAVVLGWVLGRS